MATPTTQEFAQQNWLLRAFSPVVRQQLLPVLELVALNMKETLNWTRPALGS